ncbi:MAG: GntR family transcriptional regulator [Acidobacteria bacterium]|nr:GntR family transcriptional regulator [Acidobacteriota bacterium]
MAVNPEFGASEKMPKYKHIYNCLQQALINREFAPGDKLPSENELVKQFGASRPTVSRALAQLESENHIERRAGSGTFVRGESAVQNFVLGLLIPDLGVTEIFEPICRGISIERSGPSHDLLWGATLSPGAPVEDQAQQLCEYYLQRRVSGIFFAPLELTARNEDSNRRITAAIDAANIPIVLLDRDLYAYPQRSKYDLVAIDHRRAGFVIANHLIEVGARRIVFFSRPHSAPTVAMRTMGVFEAIHTAADRNGADCKVIGWTECGDPSDVRLLEAIMTRHRPDAFVCANDFTAARLMTSLNALGIDIPGQVKVTGFDDVRYASLLQTPLTTIRQPCLELGATALAAMFGRIANPGMPARDYLIDFQLVVRQSTGLTVPSKETTKEI